MEPTTIADVLGMVSATDLAAAVRGEVDVMELIRAELISRGIGIEGAWVGFDKAREQLGTKAA